MEKKYLVWNAAKGTLFGWVVNAEGELVTAGGMPGVTDRAEVEALAAAEGAELEIQEAEA